MKGIPTRTIVFITGAFVSSSCWDNWKIYYEQNGYKTIAPSWPHKDASAEVLRNSHPNEKIASMRLSVLVDYYASVVKALPEKPILIGHSIGGLIVQLLLQQGLGALGVAIHSVPPQGIFTFKLSFLKAGWGPLGFFTSAKKTFLMSFEQWQYAFTNGMECDEQKDAYYKFAIPESKLIVRDTITKAARVNFENPHAPLLLTSGSADNTIPASLNYANYKKYGHSNSVTDYKEFEGRNHFVLGQSTWEIDAEYILKWIEKQSKYYEGK
ncbi:alpha/beta fold hydrolase [Chitinophaga ginsengisoli]|uniref:Alpha-beta hydrolase superfamily lysophospholipase n=1 Tax=Chitinophaga ginsengisoli TaxID=363837 RepID=A0A2P8FMN8_9BACT|nr:alpha/beta hydrolase [Chitinophaga ginsengisoli]PSL22997.1 alpha-beta hydrolase superfamily lysophospholipase [Chitinophaga ginsengisoli]